MRRIANIILVFRVSFSPDGQFIATASREKLAILWSLDRDQLDKSAMLGSMDLEGLIGRGCEWVGDYLRNNSKDSDRSLCESAQ